MLITAEMSSQESSSVAGDGGWDGFQDLEWVGTMMSGALTFSIALGVKCN